MSTKPMSIKRLTIDLAHAVPDFSLEVRDTLELSGCTAIFGPSGAGKSTLLRLIAGLTKPDRGRITFGDTVWTDTDARAFLPAHKRRVGILFQDGRLFPHLSVQQNLAYADQRSHSDQNRYTADQVVDAFDLAGLLQRRPDTLSGGERQRVALARTLLTRPDLLLLDEPLSALDARRKAEILPYLDDLPARFGAPAIYVSHNVDEIVRLADQTVILNQGRIDAIGSTADLLSGHGAAAFASGAVLQGTVITHDEALFLTRVDIAGGTLALPMNRRKSPGDTVNILIDARSVAIATAPPDGLSIQNILPATIGTIEPRPDSAFADVSLQVAGNTLRAQITRAAIDALSLSQGQSVYALIKSASFDL